jgi:hypothetical protein
VSVIVDDSEALANVLSVLGKSCTVQLASISVAALCADPAVSVLYAMLAALPVRRRQCASATEIQRRVW